MKESSEGLVPARGFLEDAMKPRPSFNDGSTCGKWIVFREAFARLFGGFRLVFGGRGPLMARERC